MTVVPMLPEVDLPPKKWSRLRVDVWRYLELNGRSGAGH